MLAAGPLIIICNLENTVKYTVASFFSKKESPEDICLSGDLIIFIYAAFLKMLKASVLSER